MRLSVGRHPGASARARDVEPPPRGVDPSTDASVAVSAKSSMADSRRRYSDPV
jgi:hypothetical protein